jgi:hypothetical protein
MAMTRLEQAALCALADLLGLHKTGALLDIAGLRTIIELHQALVEDGSEEAKRHANDYPFSEVSECK